MKEARRTNVEGASYEQGPTSYEGILNACIDKEHCFILNAFSECRASIHSMDKL
jgi:hypothetical protein